MANQKRTFWKWFEGWHRYPELSRFPTEKEAKKVFRGATPQWPFLGLMMVGIVTVLIAGDFCEQHFGRWAGRLATVVAIIATTQTTVFLLRKRVRRRLRESLVSLGVPICIPCGYDLRGLTEPRCPECGTPFDSALLDEIKTNTESKES